jgi:hypothetical protein
MRGVRAAYRGAARVAAAAGRPMAPWVRTSCDISTWCADPSIRRTVEDAVTRESSLLRSRFEMVDLTETIAQAFDRHALAIEVALNLYRAERVLQRLRADACQSHE